MTISTEQAAGARTPHKRVPDFFIVGHHKSGTTALYEMLRRHPEIYMPSVKEPRFFAADLRPLLAPPSGLLPESLEEYLSLFDEAKPEQRTGEASPSYLRSRTAASAIADVQPAARIIAILREPASFIRSLHLQMVQEHVEGHKDLREAFANERILREGRRVLRYSDHVRYVEQLRRYHDVFSEQQVLVLIYDDFRSDNEATVRRVLRFLDVDDTRPLELVEANPTVAVRSAPLNRITSDLRFGRGPIARALKAPVKAIAPQRLRRRGFDALRNRFVYREPPPVDEAFMAELRRRFKPEVIALGEYLDRDLAELWGYDELE
jgi:hypothetical protein